MSKPKVVILATAGLTTNLLYTALAENMEVAAVFIEAGESKKTVLKRRRKKLGLMATLGQIGFMVCALPLIPSRKKRIAQILAMYLLKDNPIPESKIQTIDTVHNPTLIKAVKAFNPDLIFINGTRIVRSAFLDEMTCPVVNIHVGITPKYRGVHGGYWALRNEDKALFGVTLHYVDKGIDTGQIIAQEVLTPDEKDNFKTYPILQYAAGIRLFTRDITAVINRTTTPSNPLTTESQLHYHPTLWTYWMGKTR